MHLLSRWQMYVERLSDSRFQCNCCIFHSFAFSRPPLTIPCRNFLSAFALHKSKSESIKAEQRCQIRGLSLAKPRKVCAHFIGGLHFFELANPHKGLQSAYFRPHLTAVVEDLEPGLSHKPTAITITEMHAMISKHVLIFTFNDGENHKKSIKGPKLKTRTFILPSIFYTT